MTRILYIVRHAKAEDRAMFMADHDRNLLPDGIMAAARMGRHLQSLYINPGLLISSTANRARDTARTMAEQLGFDLDVIEYDSELFEGGPKAYLAVVNSLPNSVDAAMIVGHNPDVSYFSEYLTHEQIGTLRKGAVVGIAFDNIAWAEVSGRMGSVVLNVSPRDLNQQNS